MADFDGDQGKFSLNQESSAKYNELSGSLEDESPSQKVMGILGGIGDSLKKNWMVVTFLLIIAVAFFGYLILQPKAGTITVEVSELDSPGAAVVGATVSLQKADGGIAVPDMLTDDLGYAKFENVPADQDLILKIVPVQSDLLTYKKTVRVKSKDSITVEALAEKRNSLSLDKNAYEFTLAPGCSQKLDVKVDNLGAEDFSTSLLADDVFEKIVRVAADEKPVQGGNSAIFPATLQLSADSENEIQGNLRLKYTNRKISLKLTKTDKKPKLDVQFDKSDARDFRAEIAQLPAVKKSQVKIRNIGGSTAPPLSGIKVSVEGDFKPWAELDLSTLDEANANGGIFPGQEVLFGLTVTVPANTPVGPYSGQLIVSSACENKPIPLSARVE